MKFLHTAGAAGLTGAVAALAVVLILVETSGGGAGYGALVGAMAKIAAWIIGPSILLTVASGLLAMVVHPPFQDAGWVWAKTATGLLVLLSGVHIMGPIQAEAKRAAAAGATDPAAAAHVFDAEVNTLWVLLVVSAANIALGVWRPKLPQYPV